MKASRLGAIISLQIPPSRFQLASSHIGGSVDVRLTGSNFGEEAQQRQRGKSTEDLGAVQDA